MQRGRWALAGGGDRGARLDLAGLLLLADSHARPPVVNLSLLLAAVSAGGALAALTLRGRTPRPDSPA